MNTEVNEEPFHGLSLTNLSIYYKKKIGGAIPKCFYDLSDGKRREWIFELLQKQYPSMPGSLLNLRVGMFYAGDCGVSEDARPDWLDIEKYKRGQAVVKRYLYGIAYSNIVSTAVGFTFVDSINFVTVTRKSSTPYTSYRRYISTMNIMLNWYVNDPFAKGTSAFDDMQLVRKLHLNVRKKMTSMSESQLSNATKIDNTWSPAYESIMNDFKDTCPALNLEQCPFSTYDKEILNRSGMTQAEMSIAQFVFSGLIILYPKDFGMPCITDEELDDYCYVWRCLGYLLGIEDEFNFCRGTLPEIQQRARDFMEVWLKPGLHLIEPKWEHMMRCMIEGMRYFLFLPSFDTSMLHCFKLLDLAMPRFEQRISVFDWIWYKVIMFTFQIAGRIPAVAYILNQMVVSWLSNGNEFSAEKKKELRQKSASIWKFEAHQTR